MYLNAFGTDLKLSGKTENRVTGISGSSTRLGTSKNDIFDSLSGDTLSGGLGDDTYNIWHSNAIVKELSGQGIDTIVARYFGKITLADNVENLILAGKGMVAGTGNALDNIIIAGDVGATLDGGRGNDVLVSGSGADVFKVAAGNGSDAIMNFVSGQDAIKLSGYGITSFSQLLSLGKQVGDDVKFSFANNESLILRDIHLSDLRSFDFGFAIDKASLPSSGQTVMNGSGRAQNWNGWYIINNSYGAGALKEGVDYTIGSSFNKLDATAGTTFTWSMPYTTELSPPILAYPEVAFGVPPMGAYAGNPGDKAAVFPIKVSDLVSLTADYDVSFTGNVSGFNVAYDIWLTSKPNGDRSTITNEIMIWVHQGNVAPYGAAVGTYKVGDVTYTIYHKDKYTALVADRDVPTGQLDITAIIAKLNSMGIVSDKEYLASIELGAEVISGVGSLTINNLDLEVQSRGENGTIIVKDVTGAGQSVHEISVLESMFSAGTEKLVDAQGLVIGKTVTTVAADAVTQKLLANNGQLLSFDKFVVEKSGAIQVQHYTAAGTLTGTDVNRTTAAGSVNIEHYDASWKFTGVDNVEVKANGDTLISHYSASWQFTGADKVVVDAKGKETTQHFDSTWKFSGADVKLIEASGTVSIQHYDSAWKFIGQDSTVVGIDGSATTYHYNASWALQGLDVERVGTNGVVTTSSYNAKWQLISTEYNGTALADTITGTAGKNIFHGGLGSDMLKGGAGVDMFVFDTAIGRGDVDKLMNFTASQDKIVLDKGIFGGLALGTLSDDSFHLGSVAKDANDHILYDSASGSLYYDADGSGAGKAILFAKLDARTPLSASNFEVVSHEQDQHVDLAVKLINHAHDYM